MTVAGRSGCSRRTDDPGGRRRHGWQTGPVKHRRLHRGLVIGSVLLVLAAGGCDMAARPTATPAPTPSPSTTPGPRASPVDPGPIYERIERQVVALRGLEATRPVKRTTIDEASLRAILTEITEREQSPAEVAATERLYKGLGLLDGDESLATISRELLGDQVAGFYRTDTRELYVVSRSGGVGVEEKVIFAHEFTHALQDQHFPLDPLTADAATEGDRALARTALIEGDATLLMTLWSQENLSFAELLALVGMAIGPSQAGLADVPPFLRDSLLFPYQAGLEFVMGLHVGGGWDAVNAAFADPPDSTEQVLHPAKYTDREAPVEVTLPAGLAARMGSGWALGLEDTLGEFQIGAWLAAGGEAAVARAAAAGWGGDRIGLLDGPDGRWAIVLETAWDTADDAAAFGAAIPERTTASVEVGDRRRVRVVIASDQATLAAARTAAEGE